CSTPCAWPRKPGCFSRSAPSLGTAACGRSPSSDIALVSSRASVTGHRPSSAPTRSWAATTRASKTPSLAASPARCCGRSLRGPGRSSTSTLPSSLAGARPQSAWPQCGLGDASAPLDGPARGAVARVEVAHPDDIFRPVPRTGVIYVMAAARERGFEYGAPDWANLGQGAPETGEIPGGAERVER